MYRIGPQNLITRLALYLTDHFSNFKFQNYLEFFSVKRFRVALSKLRVSSHRLESCEAGRWARPVKLAYDERKCRVCNILEDVPFYL